MNAKTLTPEQLETLRSALALLAFVSHDLTTAADCIEAGKANTLYPRTMRKLAADYAQAVTTAESLIS